MKRLIASASVFSRFRSYAGRPQTTKQANDPLLVPGEPLDPSAIRGELEKLHLASFGWALGCCRRHHADAEDVLQTAYCKILTGQARYDGRAHFKSWLFAVIRNTAIDMQRRAGFRRWFLVDLAEPAAGTAPAAAREPSPDRPTMQLFFQEALDALPDRQREVLHLVFYQHLSVQQAASVMGVSLGSARTHYERGKRRLRERLTASPIFHESGLLRPNARPAF